MPLQNNKKVLRFFCVWDNRQDMYGDRRPYVLHLYLEDDSVEILEVNTRNSGRDPFPVFMKRARLPKVGLTDSWLAAMHRDDASSYGTCSQGSLLCAVWCMYSM